MKYKHIYCEWDVDGGTYHPDNTKVILRTCLYCKEQAPIAIKQICSKKPWLLGDFIWRILNRIGITEKRFNATFNHYKVIGGCGTAQLIKVPKKERGCDCPKRRKKLNYKHKYYKMLVYEKGIGGLYAFYMCVRYSLSRLSQLYGTAGITSTGITSTGATNQKSGGMQLRKVPNPNMITKTKICPKCGKPKKYVTEKTKFDIRKGQGQAQGQLAEHQLRLF